MIQPFLKKIQTTLDYLLSKIKGIEKEVNTLNSTVNNIIVEGAVSEIILGKTLIVSKQGNDTTAGNHDLSKHWLNPTVAMANASVGDTVVVYPGTYIIGSGGLTDDGNQQMVKAGVILHMMPGAKIHYTNTTGTISTPFTDVGGGSTDKFIIRGRGDFQFDADISTTYSFNLLTLGTSELDWEFNTISAERGFSLFGLNIRMVGRQFINEGSYIVGLTGGNNVSRNVNIDIESVIINNNSADDTVTRQSVNSFDSKSVINIKYDTVIFTNSDTYGGFQRTTLCKDETIFNLTINSIIRTGPQSYIEHLVKVINSYHSGTTIIRGIKTQKGILSIEGMSDEGNFDGTGTGGDNNQRHKYIFSGVITATTLLDSIHIIEMTDLNMPVVTEVDLTIMNGSRVSGVWIQDCTNHILTGSIYWESPLGYPLRATPSYDAGLYKDLVILMRHGQASVYNSHATATAEIKILNVYATNGISTTGGGVTQLIETIKVDSNI